MASNNNNNNNCRFSIRSNWFLRFFVAVSGGIPGLKSNETETRNSSLSGHYFYYGTSRERMANGKGIQANFNM